ncbi:hypothetical protein BC827DRAFT_1156922 [Russula dissimulans]|nr:hypothetical protein BC827DRAFT_1156922 [Russula dissimulans]
MQETTNTPSKRLWGIGWSKPSSYASNWALDNTSSPGHKDATAQSSTNDYMPEVTPTLDHNSPENNTTHAALQKEHDVYALAEVFAYRQAHKQVQELAKQLAKNYQKFQDALEEEQDSLCYLATSNIYKKIEPRVLYATPHTLDVSQEAIQNGLSIFEDPWKETTDEDTKNGSADSCIAASSAFVQSTKSGSATSPTCPAASTRSAMYPQTTSTNTAVAALQPSKPTRPKP